MRLLHSLGFIACALSLTACSDVQLFGLDPENFTEVLDHQGPEKEKFVCDGVDRDFETDVLPVLENTCATVGCHTGPTAAGIGNNVFFDLDTTDNTRAVTASAMIGYLTIIKTNAVNTGTPFNSDILRRPLAEAANGLPHPVDIFETTQDPDYKKIRCWIEDGAPNTTTDSDCSFGSEIYPTMTYKISCGTNCHQGNSPKGGFSLDKNLTSDEIFGEFMEPQYNSIPGISTKRVDTDNPAQSGTLYFPLNNELAPGAEVPEHVRGYNNQLEQDPRYEKLLCWIQEGALNN